MQILKLTEEIESWKPNIAELGERLIMGPQRNVLEQVEAINNRYDLSLRITRTYRWSAGYMDQIKKWMNERYVEPHMKRKISTFFNKIDEKQWSYRDLRDKLNRLDDEMSSMRSRRQVFQDNSEIVETVWDALMNKLSEQLNNMHQYFNVYIGHVQNHNRYGDLIDDIDNQYVVFVCYLPETQLNYFIGQDSYPIPVYETTLFYAMPLDDLLYKASANLDWLEDKEANILSHQRSYPRYGHGSEFGNWRGIYHRNYINEAESFENRTGYGYRNSQLLHPYISNEEANGKHYFLKDTDGSRFSHAYCCLGNFTDSIHDDLRRLDIKSIYSTLYHWHTVFNSTSTQPMNPITSMFFGKHKFMDETFGNVVNTLQNNCRIASTSNSGPKTYCDDYECEYRKTCSYYTQDGGELADQDGETEDLPLPADFEVVNDDADNIQGGEYAQTHTVGRDEQWDPESLVEEISRVNRENGLTDDGEQTLEERIIAWASQRGGAINIATNERNSNG